MSDSAAEREGGGEWRYGPDICAGSWIMAWGMGVGRGHSRGVGKRPSRSRGHAALSMVRKRRASIAHQDCVIAVVNFIQERDLKDVILVGHSFGGTVIQKVAEVLPDRIARVVYLDRPILRDKVSVLDILPPEFAALVTAMANASSENTMLIPWEAWRDHFIQDAPLGNLHALWIQTRQAKLCPTSC